jgi:Ca-activated chloride channel homolog
VVALAKRYGITTPYTSYLIVPDAPVPVAAAGRAERGAHGRPNVAFGPGGGLGGPVPPGLAPDGKDAPAKKVADFLKQVKDGDSKGDEGKEGLEGARRKFEDDRLAKTPAAQPPRTDPSGRPVPPGSPDVEAEALRKTGEKLKALDQARNALLRSRLDEVQAGRLGVDLSVQTDDLRRQSRLSRSAIRRAGDRRCLEVGGVWIDEDFDAKMPTMTVKAMSKAYFRILERHPSVREVFRLGNYLVWVTPSGTALVVDTRDGREDMSDADIDRLFQKPRKK